MGLSNKLEPISAVQETILTVNYVLNTRPHVIHQTILHVSLKLKNAIVQT